MYFDRQRPDRRRGLVAFWADTILIATFDNWTMSTIDAVGLAALAPKLIGDHVDVDSVGRRTHDASLMLVGRK